MSADLARINRGQVVDAVMTHDERITYIRNLIASQQARVAENDRKGMVLGRMLADLRDDGEWLRAHRQIGKSRASRPDSDAEFAHWATEDQEGPRFGITRGSVQSVLGLVNYERSIEFRALDSKPELTLGAWQRVVRVTGRASTLSNRDKYMPELVRRATEAAAAAGQDVVTTREVRDTALELIAEVQGRPVERRNVKRTRADVLRSRIIGAAKVLVAMGALRALGEAINDCTEILDQAKADR